MKFFEKLSLEADQYSELPRQKKMKYLYEIGFSYDEVDIIIYGKRNNYKRHLENAKV